MAFVYERVHPEDEELWNSIGWRDWKNAPLSYANYRKWCIDRGRKAYLKGIGGFIDMPDYYDFCYKGVIVRMEISNWCDFVLNPEDDFETDIAWYIDNMYIPESIWEDREEIVKLVKEAFSVNTSAAAPGSLEHIAVEMQCEPKLVEADYNGR